MRVQKPGLAMAESTVDLHMDGGVARVTLARPDVRNAFNAEVIGELHASSHASGEHTSVRAVVLAGEGNVFCGGADVNWMRASLDALVRPKRRRRRAHERYVPRDRPLPASR